MPTETRPIPRLAKSAATLAHADFQRVINNLGVQTLEVMGLLASEGWFIDFTDGIASREVPDIKPAPTEPVTEPKAAAEA